MPGRFNPGFSGCSPAMATKILVVDDEAGMRRSLAIMLRREGYEVLEASGGKDALDQFGEEELLAILPAIAELGTQAVLSLHAKLDSSNSQLRQAAAILLSLTRDTSSTAPLMRRLLREETKIWIDVARAIGSLGSSTLERL